MVFLLEKYSVQFLKKYPALEEKRAAEIARLIVEENRSPSPSIELLTMTFRKIDQFDMELASGMAKTLVLQPQSTSISQVKEAYHIDVKSVELREKYGKLEYKICDEIAERLYKNKNLTLEKSLEEIFNYYRSIK